MGRFLNTKQTLDELNAERRAHEDATIAALCRVIEAGMDPDGTLSIDRQKRRDVQDCHLETAALLMSMPMSTPKHAVTALAALVSVWRDLSTATPEERSDAGEMLRLAVPFIRRSRGLA